MIHWKLKSFFMKFCCGFNRNGKNGLGNVCIKSSFFYTLVWLCLFQSAIGQQLISSSGADTWVAVDGLGRKLEQEIAPKSDRYVGMFYFIWQGAHGYDRHAGGNPDESVMKKNPGDTLSPYDISKLIQRNPEAPQYGPVHAFHHWGEPQFGYYLSDDEWIIRKHAQMLSDAGVDVIILDVTNAAIYLTQVMKIAHVYRQMRKEGISTPYISFITNSHPEKTVQRLYDQIYKPNLFQDLWFYWKGKPLLLTSEESLTDETRHFFSVRRSWAWSKGQEWFGDGRDKWPWLDHYPQSYGWHEAKDQPEAISVSIAQHPMSNIGRSFHDGKQPIKLVSEKGLYFSEQWKRALEVDPEFVFVTGWNEWVAMRFVDGASKFFLGKPIEKGETYFVDCYNAEFSRDAEPAKDTVLKDHYYYQLVNFIRQYKGTRSRKIDTEFHKIKIDGDFQDWHAVSTSYPDDRGDTFHRNHPGWGRIENYSNTSGRNDIVEAKITTDREAVYFYVQTSEPITAFAGTDWMNLWIGIHNSQELAWEGFQYLVNKAPKNNTQTSLHKYDKAQKWKAHKSISYRVGTHELELRIPKLELGITSKGFIIDFKWQDHIPLDGDPMHWLDTGDTAPNARFRYRYVFNNENNFP
jgi:hypothetical protein